MTFEWASYNIFGLCIPDANGVAPSETICLLSCEKAKEVTESASLCLRPVRGRVFVEVEAGGC
jgi:hypothetical protein